MRSIWSRPSRAGVLFLSLLLALAAATTSGRAGAPALKAGTFEPPHAAPEFSLAGSDAAEVTLARYRGKVVLLAFGFTNCPAVCPTTLATLAAARKSLGEAAGSVQVIFVTVDPERDDATRMKDYLANFDPSFEGATGDPGALAAVRQKYGVTAVKHATSDGYVIDHTSSVYLIDRAGKLRAMMPFGHADDDFAHDIKLLLVQ